MLFDGPNQTRNIVECKYNWMFFKTHHHGIFQLEHLPGIEACYHRVLNTTPTLWVYRQLSNETNLSQLQKIWASSASVLITTDRLQNEETKCSFYSATSLCVGRTTRPERAVTSPIQTELALLLQPSSRAVVKIVGLLLPFLWAASWDVFCSGRTWPWGVGTM